MIQIHARKSSSARGREQEQDCACASQRIVSRYHPFASSQPICDSGQEVPNPTEPEDP